MAAGYFTLNGTDEHLWGSDGTMPDITGDFEIIICIRTHSTLGNDPLFDKLNSSSQGYRTYMLSSGEIQVGFGNGSSSVYTVSSGSPISTDDDVWIKVEADPDNGSNRVGDFYYSYDPPETAIGSVSWTQIGSQVTGTQHGVVGNTDSLRIGNNTAGGAAYFPGRVYCGEVYDGIGGTRIANPDFRDTDQGDWSVADFGPISDDESTDWYETGDPVYTPETVVGGPPGRRLILPRRGLARRHNQVFS